MEQQTFPFKVVYRGNSGNEYVVAQFVMSNDRDLFMLYNTNPKYTTRDEEQ